MFESLSEKLDVVFRRLRGHGKLTEKNVEEALREVRLALLEADVNFRVVKDFVERIKSQALGQEVLASLSPGQQVIKIVNAELVALLGGQHAELSLSAPPPVVIMLVGSAADPVAITQEGVDAARRQGYDVAIIDTAGRLQIDEELMLELERMKAATHPHQILLVADAMTGQEAVNVAAGFHNRIGLDGVILTKVEGDARGGAALSLRAVTGKPILFIGVGEKLDALEPFYPDRAASRILGMGDVLSLIEKAEKVYDQRQAEILEKKLRKNQFTLEDFQEQIRMLKKMGSVTDLVAMLPGGKKLLQGADMEAAEKEFKHIEAIISSMTKEERRKPEILNGSRRRRIASGSGTSVTEVNRFLKQYLDAKKMMRKISQLGMGKMGRNLPSLWGNG
ncbi:MAG: signal recognition particle protein [Deltaproteobacteria bacterium]|nr:signal recognition particle protein [Deltaproteobacteria bacterium]